MYSLGVWFLLLCLECLRNSTEYIRKDSWHSGRDLNLGPSTCIAGALITTQQCSGYDFYAITGTLALICYLLDSESTLTFILWA